MERETIYRGAVVALHRLGGRWEYVEHAPAVAILALRDGRVLGVRQRRPVIGAETWELPAGLVDPGESPAEAAARELAEEAQLGGRLEPLTRFWTSPGFTDEHITLFRATALEPRRATPDEHEELRVEWLEPAEVWRRVAAGELATSSVTLIGVRHAMAILDGDPNEDEDGGA